MDIVIGLLCLNVIVFFHELGHFIVAKLNGVKVLTFSIGMGPVLLRKMHKGTEYRLSLLPIGGYCGMEGENDFQNAIENNSDTINASKTSLYGVHPLRRALIALAGPFSNFVISVVAFTIVLMVGYTFTTYTNRIILPDETVESPARNAGMLSGDKIIKINGTEIKYFYEIQKEISFRPKEEIDITVDRNGEILNFKIKTLLNKDMGNGIIGITCDDTELVYLEAKTYSLFPAIYRGILKTGEMIGATLKSLTVLFKGVNISKTVSGPIRISLMLGESVRGGFKENFRTGLYSLMELCALISISLGIMNLLPIPVFDGGLIFIALIEAITRKRIPPKVQLKIQIIGVAIIIFILIFVVMFDINYFVTKWGAAK
ncbi:MAG: site-2 protease family protein [Treponema sp.]|uniref:M50 family metallopeptidase n=1 Tax=Treponema sp. TaxID=166 RepID=UPI00298D742C|nr:M50 family metallopeptidase [Treponema sp.]MBR5934509.1 site-2 protease family protein [Treponema sp.]